MKYVAIKIMQVLILFTISFITPVFAYSQSLFTSLNPKDYKENNKLGAYLEKEGFKFDITCAQARNLYDMTGEPNLRSNKIETSPVSGVPWAEGFYEAICKDGYLFMLKKCIIREKGNINEDAIKNDFKNKYSLKDNGYFVYRNRYYSIDIFHDKNMRDQISTIMIRVTDLTKGVNEAIEGQNKTNKLKNRY